MPSSPPLRRVLAHERPRGTGHHFRFELSRGNYRLAEESARGSYGCRPQPAIVKPGRTVGVTVESLCDVP